ncbi:MAG: hypothetical protein LBP95_03295 [Deltaproteobacteria bacterium]|nr:hypothetical protein [Deltaproteobacteria bacterium]
MKKSSFLKRFKRKTTLALTLTGAALLVSAALPSLLAAHGVAWRQAPSDRTYTIGFMYSDQTPMAYSEVKVYSPDNSELEYQNSRTDANGWFAFVPDVPGEWSFASNDGMGHLSSGKLEVVFESPAAPAEPASDGTPADASAPAPAPAAAGGPAQAMASGGSAEPTVVRAGFGISIILNFLFIALWLRRRPGGDRKAPGSPGAAAVRG